MPPLSEGFIRIRTGAIGLNFADIFALTGLYSATPDGAFIPGLEFAGEVIAVGPGAQATEVPFTPGRRVMGVTRFGAYADHIDVSPNHCKALPEEWQMTDGAAFAVQAATAWYALKNLGDARPGQTVLVHSAAGGVGLAALKICRALGLSAIGTVGSVSKKRFLEKEGFSPVIVRSRDFPEDLAAALAGAPLHLVLDAIGGEVFKASYAALAPTGRMVTFGAATFTPGKDRPRWLHTILQYLRRPRLDPLKMISENKSVMGFNLIWLWEEPGLFESLMAEITAQSLGKPHVGHVFPFDSVFEAIETLRSGGSMGKVVLTI